MTLKLAVSRSQLSVPYGANLLYLLFVIWLTQQFMYFREYFCDSCSCCDIGGGGLALCGTGTLHCWAETVDEVVHRFTDRRRIDRSKLMDDSAYR